MKPRWPINAKLYWCIDRNVPLLSPFEKEVCSAVEVKIGPPGDARPAFRIDKERLREACRNEFGSIRAYDVLFGNNRFIVLNKIPYLDEMREVVVDGAIVGKLYYEPVEKLWRLRLAYPGASRLVEEGIIDAVRLARGERLRPYDKLRRQGIPQGQQVVLVDAEGSVRGIGYSQGDYIRVWNVFYTRELPPGSGKPADKNTFLRVNDHYFYVVESRAIGFVASMAAKTGLPVVASYSGGKDSLVSMDLVLRAGLEPMLLFNDTGMEFPEVVSSVYKAADTYDLRLTIASAGDAFWRTVGFFGPPARDYRWCCKVAKLAPLARTARRIWPHGMLNIVGQRAFESMERARSPRVWRNKWTPYILSISPIQTWTQLTIWGYIWRRRLEPNPLYSKGFERLGCYMCPASSLAEFDVVRKIHPEMWERWENILWKWAERLGMPSEWVSLGLWRWLGPASAKKRLAQHAGVELGDWREWYTRWIAGRPLFAEEKEKGVIRASLILPFEADTRALKDQYPAIALEADTAPRLTLRRIKSIVYMDNSTIEARGGGEWIIEDLMDAAKLVYRWHNCAGCGNCEASCPTNAISIKTGRPTIDPSQCIHCRLCIYNCPISEVYFEHLVAAVALDRPDAWRRSSRPPRKLVVEAAKKLLGRSPPRREGEGEPSLPKWSLMFPRNPP